jgi:hypothetical protein
MKMLESTKSIADVRSRLKNIRSAESLDDFCEALLTSGWDYRDPAGRMHKSPEEVEDFLMSFTTRTATFTEMRNGPRAGMFNMVIDAYERALRAARDGGPCIDRATSTDDSIPF